jgi:5'-3' exonuclease
MILYDFSSLIHRSIYNAPKLAEASKKDGKFVTDEYIHLVIYKILDELINTDFQHGPKYGDLIVCLDDSSRKYWRNEIYDGYKQHRKKTRDESEINFPEVFKHINVLIEVLKRYSPWKVFAASAAEADDTIAILAKKYCDFEPILIHSPDKDMIQLHKYGNIDQYSAITGKWILPEHKGSLEEWKMEHVVLGDASDGVPRVVDHTEFSEAFLNHIKQYTDITEVKKFNEYFGKLENLKLKKKIFDTFDVWKLNRKKEPVELDIYVKPRFGLSNLKKTVDKYGSLEKWLDSHPLYREHYKRNEILVLEENIPVNVVAETISSFNESETNFTYDMFHKYLDSYNLGNIKQEFRKIMDKYGETQELTAENCGW